MRCRLCIHDLGLYTSTWNLLNAYPGPNPKYSLCERGELRKTRTIEAGRTEMGWFNNTPHIFYIGLRATI